MALIRQNIVANYFGQGWSGFMAMAFLPAYIKYLGSEAYGLIGLFAVVQALFTILDMGMSPVLNRELARTWRDTNATQHIRNLLCSVEMVCFGLIFVLILLGCIVSDYVAQEWLKSELLTVQEVSHAIVLMTIVASLRLCEGVYRGSLFGLEQQVWYNLTYSLISTVRYLGALAVLVYLSPTIEAFFIWQVAVSLIAVIVLAVRVHLGLPKAPNKPRWSWESLAGVWKFARGMMGLTFLTMLFLQLDKLLLSRFTSLADLGYYTLAATAANVMFMVVVPITQAVYPELIRLTQGGGRSRLESLYHGTTQLVVVITAAVAMIFCVFSDGLIFLWSGNSDLVRNTAPLLSILALGSFLNCLSYLPTQLQIARGWTSQLLKINLFVVLIFAPALLLAINEYGVVGAAWGWVAVNAINLLLISRVTHRILFNTYQVKWYFIDILLPTVGAVIAVLIAKQFQPINYMDRAQWLLFLAIAGAGTIATSSLFSSSIRKYLRNAMIRKYK